MNSLSYALKTARKMLIEPGKAQAYVERVANVNVQDIRAGDIEDVMKMMFGEQPEMIKGAGIAIIPVKGVIGSGLTDLEKMMGAVDVEDVEEMIEDAERDENVKVVVFDFDTPGGTCTGVPELAKRIRKCPKRTIAWTCKQCCSAGVWLSSQCDEVWISGSSTYGSIGVYVPVMIQEKQYAEEGIEIDVIKSGWAKAAGFPGTRMTPEQRKLWQDDVIEHHKWFITDVSMVRTFAKEEDMQGQCWSGRKAAEKNLVTGIKDTFDDLLKYIGEDVYEEFEHAEEKVESEGPSSYAIAKNPEKLMADVSPEQGDDTDGVKPVSDKDKDDKKKKKKKKSDHEDDEDEDEEMPEVPEKDCPPVETDDQKA